MLTVLMRSLDCECGAALASKQPLARAVEKARTQGARLILAEARENQCWMYGYFDQVQNAVAACRESMDIYAAAGDRQGEAQVLQVWATAINETDAPESIRLYQQAKAIFQKVGSEGGAASVLNNLGLIYEMQGDPATAEKLQRKALTGFRLLDDTRREAKVTANIGNDRVDQGDLRGALQLYEESMRTDPEDAGRVTIAGDNIADVHHWQGDLAAAKQGHEQSLAAWQKAGDLDSSAYAMSSLGRIFLDEADFSGARKMYQQSLAIRTSAGDKLTIAETQLGFADLSLEEAHPPVDQEAAIRQVIEVFQQQRSRDNETQAWCILARALLAEGKLADATAAMQHARSLAAKSQNPEVRWQTAVAAAHLETAGKDAAHSTAGIATRTELAVIITKSRELGFEGTQLDARLALAEIEMQSGQALMGREHLVAIEADAKAKGYNLIARKAAIARA